MNKLMLLGGVTMLALAGPALAQTVAGPAPEATPAEAPNDPAAAAPADATAPTDGGAQTTAPAVDAAAAPDIAASAAAAATDSAAPPTAVPTETGTAAAPSVEVVAKVNADWAKYDEGNKGKLTPLEFGSWVMAAKGQDVTAQVEKSKTSKRANLPAIKVLNATAADFSKADTDKDKTISPNELATYLSA